MNNQLVSVVLPVYNQADHIGDILRHYLAALSKTSLNFELLPVVNGPRKDNSLEICQSISAEDARVRTIVIDEGGWGRAVREGLQQAKGEILCFTNCARTAPGDLTLLLLYGVAHSDTVIKANRKMRDSFFRRFGSVIYNFECRTLFDLAVWDVNGTPKVFPRACDKLMNLTQNGDLIDLEFNVIVRQSGYPILEVPIVNADRHGGSSTTNFKSAWRMYLGAWQMSRKMGANH